MSAAADESLRGDQIKTKMDNAIMFSESFSIRMILDTERSDQFMIVKSVGERKPS